MKDRNKVNQSTKVDEYSDFEDTIGATQEVIIEAADVSDITWADAPVFGIFWILLAVVFLQFFTRYILNNSLSWTEEVARYLLILIGFVGSITCVRKGSHIFLEFFYRYINKKTIKSLVIVVNLILFVFFFFLGISSIELANNTFARMISMDIPKASVYWLVTATCFIMSIMSIKNVIYIWKKPANEFMLKENILVDS